MFENMNYNFNQLQPKSTRSMKNCLGGGGVDVPGELRNSAAESMPTSLALEHLYLARVFDLFSNFSEFDTTNTMI